MNLQSKNNTETNRYELELAVSPEEFEQAIQSVFKRESKKMTIPGFRKGKAPRGFLEKYYGEQVFFEAAVDHLYRDMVDFAVEHSELDVVRVTNFNIEEIGKEKGILAKLAIVVKPEVSIQDYKGIALTKPASTVSEEDITGEIDRVRERNARTVSVTDRAVKDGDITVIDFDGSVDGVAFDGGKSENHELTIGAGQFIPGFEEQMIGHTVGEEFDVNVTFPEDYHAEELKGKAAVFKIKLHEIKEKELPAFDEEFVKDISEFDTVEAYREDVTKKLLEQKEHAAEHELEHQMIDTLIGKTEVELPEEMVENEVDEIINSFAYRLQSQGLNLETYLQYTGMTVEQMRTQYHEQAHQQVTIRLALEKIAELENIKPSDEEIAEEYEKLAKAYEMEVDKVKSMVSADALVGDIANQKVMAFVKDNAVITEGDVAEIKAGSAADEEEAPTEEADA